MIRFVNFLLKIINHLWILAEWGKTKPSKDSQSYKKVSNVTDLATVKPNLEEDKILKDTSLNNSSSKVEVSQDNSQFNGKITNDWILKNQG